MLFEYVIGAHRRKGKQVMHTSVVQKYSVSHKKLAKWGWCIPDHKEMEKKSRDLTCVWFYLFHSRKKDGTEARRGEASNISDKRHERQWRQNREKERFWLNVRKEEGATWDVVFLGNIKNSY